ncbi:MAG: hypothetical protein V4674_02005 [Patescibacteria group bacterium]
MRKVNGGSHKACRCGNILALVFQEAETNRLVKYYQCDNDPCSLVWKLVVDDGSGKEQEATILDDDDAKEVLLKAAAQDG